MMISRMLLKLFDQSSPSLNSLLGLGANFPWISVHIRRVGFTPFLAISCCTIPWFIHPNSVLCLCVMAPPSSRPRSSLRTALFRHFWQTQHNYNYHINNNGKYLYQSGTESGQCEFSIDLHQPNASSSMRHYTTHTHSHTNVINARQIS